MKFIKSLAQCRLLPIPRRRRSLTQSAIANIDTLEDRVLLSSVSGTSWNDASQLTLSFAPDGTDVAGKSSQLFSQFSGVATAEEVRSTIIEAFQTWSVHANINIGLVSDGGQELGATGDFQGDSRFGDVRIVSVPLSSDVVAISIPRNGAVSGTWVGDIVINSNYEFANLDELFAAVLHESGHVLGLSHSDDPLSPMHSSGLSTEPTSDDIQELQRVNGVRTDFNEQKVSNDTLKNSTRIKFSENSSGFDGSTPLISSGDISTADDIDIFELRSLSNYTGTVTFSLRIETVSQLRGKITVVNEKGDTIASAVISSYGQDVTVTVPHVEGESLYAIVEGAGDSGLFGIGAYALVTTFDGRLTTSPDLIDLFVQNRYEFLDDAMTDEFFSNDGDVDFETELNLNDNITVATNIKSSPYYVEDTYYKTAGAISTPSDVDFYRVKSPDYESGETGTLVVNVKADQFGTLLPKVTAFDANGQLLDSEVVENRRGSYSIQISGIERKLAIYLKVEASYPEGRYSTGNYHLVARFQQDAAPWQQVANTTLNAAEPTDHFETEIAQTTLINFALDVSSQSDGIVAVQMFIYDEFGNVVQAMVARTGETRTGQATIFAPGRYRIRIHANTADGSPIPDVQVGLRAIALSVPLGPTPEDPTTAPPDETSETDVILSEETADWPEDSSLTDPWMDEPFLDPADDTLLDPFLDPEPIDSLEMWSWV